jgi:two-component system sensor histidine kinase/response regulator
MNILLVDDIPINNHILKCFLEDHNISEASDGSIAVELVKDNDYDIIFMDMMMPIMNGYEATVLIKEIKPHIPIYIVSAYLESDFPSDWKKAQYEDVLKKPVSKKIINNIISKHI